MKTRKKRRTRIELKPFPVEQDDLISADETWIYVDQKPKIKLSDLEEISGFGIGKEQIADWFGINRKFFSRKDRPDVDIVNAAIERGLNKAIVKVTRRLFQAATSEESFSLGANIFWLKNKAGWKDVQENKHDVLGTLSELLKQGQEKRQKELNDSN